MPEPLRAARRDGLLTQKDSPLPTGKDGLSYVYQLVDPLTSLPRYIGVSNTPKNRLKLHRKAAEDGATTAVYEWWRQVLQRTGGHPPVMRTIDGPIHDDRIAEEREGAWEAIHRTAGIDLVNSAPCGSRRPTASIRSKPDPSHLPGALQELRYRANLTRTQAAAALRAIGEGISEDQITSIEGGEVTVSSHLLGKMLLAFQRDRQELDDIMQRRSLPKPDTPAELLKKQFVFPRLLATRAASEHHLLWLFRRLLEPEQEELLEHAETLSGSIALLAAYRTLSDEDKQLVMNCTHLMANDL